LEGKEDYEHLVGSTTQTSPVIPKIKEHTQMLYAQPLDLFFQKLKVYFRINYINNYINNETSLPVYFKNVSYGLQDYFYNKLHNSYQNIKLKDLYGFDSFDENYSIFVSPYLEFMNKFEVTNAYFSGKEASKFNDSFIKDVDLVTTRAEEEALEIDDYFLTNAAESIKPNTQKKIAEFSRSYLAAAKALAESAEQESDSSSSFARLFAEATEALIGTSEEALSDFENLILDDKKVSDFYEKLFFNDVTAPLLEANM